MRILPPIVVRDMLGNSTMSMSAGLNATQVDREAARDYNTAEYRVYIALLVFGIVIAVLVLPVAGSMDILRWYRWMRKKKAIKQRKIDVEIATAKIREMTQPESAYLRPERFG